MAGPKTLFCSSNFPWAREMVSSKFIDHLGARPQKGLPPLSERDEKPEPDS